MKYLYRIMFLLVLFVGSLFFFGSNMKENSFKTEEETIELSKTSLPVVFMRVADCDFNRLHGYSSNLDAMLIRESMTPVMEDQSIVVVIDENEYEIRKVAYEIIDTETGDTVEDSAVIALDKEGDYKTAKIRIKTELVKDREYAAKITLISNESKRIYYYTRIMLCASSNLLEKLEFADMFHIASLDDEKVNTLKKYLETKRGSNTVDYSYVDIYSTPEMIAYGELTPSIIYEELPVITEYSKDTASVVISYYMSMITANGTEYYNVKEYYRFRYTASRVYLYDYKRYTETVFDYRMISVSKNEFKLGITREVEVCAKASPDESKSAFVRSNTLWLYDYEKSQIISVFSFKQDDTDYFRDAYAAHDIKILNVKDDGSIDFMVYGYMNRGGYEGRVGIVFYEYNPYDVRIKELIYIPVNTTYALLKEATGDFAYKNKSGILYFNAYNKLYSYNFVSRTLNIISEDVSSDKMYYSEKLGYLAWQDKPEASKTINVLMLESGEKLQINAKDDDYISFYGSIDENLIYGHIRNNDISKDDLGNTIYPAYSIEIADYTGKTLKKYEKENYFVTGASVEDNIVTLYRLKTADNKYSGYEKAEDDCILNSKSEEIKPFETNTRATDLTLTEYYLTLTKKTVVSGIPKLSYSKNTVLTKDTTLRISKPDNFNNHYYAYSFGEMVYAGNSAGQAVIAADNGVGTAVDENGKIIWQRGTKKTRNELEGISPVYNLDSLDSVMAAIKMLCIYKNVDVTLNEDIRKNLSVAEAIRNYTKLHVIDLTGASLDEVLYMVSKGKTVIGMIDDNYAVLIYAYDSYYVTFIDAYLRKTVKMSLKEAEQKFSENDNRFISYYE